MLAFSNSLSIVPTKLLIDSTFTSEYGVDVAFLFLPTRRVQSKH